jgi:hypothetical protein
MAAAWISWRNWVSETGANFSGEHLLASAPASNIADPRPDVRAVWSPSYNEASIEFRVGLWSGNSAQEGVPVEVVAIIGTNFASVTPAFAIVEWRFWNTAGSYTDIAIPPREYYGEKDLLQTIVHRIEPANPTQAAILANVARIRLRVSSTAPFGWGYRDPFRGILSWNTANADVLPSIGTVWAGPIWRPSSGVGIRGYAETIVDPSDVQRTLSGSMRAQVRRKLRVQSGTIVAVSHDEYSGVPRGLREMIAHAGVSRPVLLQPGDGFAPIYGLFQQPPVWEALDKSDRGVIGSAAYTVREIR